MFKVGDKVRCVRASNNAMQARLGQVATVVGTVGENLILTYPFHASGVYSPEQFELFYDIQ